MKKSDYCQKLLNCYQEKRLLKPLKKHLAQKKSARMLINLLIIQKAKNKYNSLP